MRRTVIDLKMCRRLRQILHLSRIGLQMCESWRNEGPQADHALSRSLRTSFHDLRDMWAYLCLDIVLSQSSEKVQNSPSHDDDRVLEYTADIVHLQRGPEVMEGGT